MPEPLIKLEDISKTYKLGKVDLTVLKGINLEISPGSFITIMGPSGSGKSTLMHIMCFLDHLTSGVYEFENQTIQDIPDEKTSEN